MKNKGNLIRRVFGGMLKEHGFILTEYHAGIIWRFERTYEATKQYVSLQKDLYTDSLSMHLGTSSGKIFRIKDFYPEFENDKDFPEAFKISGEWDFADEEEFSYILNKFGRLVIEYGIDIMNQNSMPSKEPTKILTLEIEEAFYKDHERMCRQFIEKYSVSLDNMEEGIETVRKLIEERYEDDFIETVPFLLEAASYLGCAIALKYKGTWEWKVFRDGSQACYVTIRAGRIKKYYAPLVPIMSIWKHKTDPEFAKRILKERFLK